MVKQSIKNCRGGGWIAKYEPPVRDRAITRYDDALGFVPLAHQLEQQVRNKMSLLGTSRNVF